MQNMDYDHEPDPMEKKIRFGCGFLFGLVIGFFEFARTMYRYNSTGAVISCAVISVFLCGWLALKYGDRFWQGLPRLRWW